LSCKVLILRLKMTHISNNLFKSIRDIERWLLKLKLLSMMKDQKRTRRLRSKKKI
jgi:hypothetical protein